MSVPSCSYCDTHPDEKRYQTPNDLAEGDYCPICHAPTCVRHLLTVRFRWRESGDYDSAKVCKRCKTSYEHRHWDTARRDWIS